MDVKPRHVRRQTAGMEGDLELTSSTEYTCRRR